MGRGRLEDGRAGIGERPGQSPRCPPPSPATQSPPGADGERSSSSAAMSNDTLVIASPRRPGRARGRAHRGQEVRERPVGHRDPLRPAGGPGGVQHVGKGIPGRRGEIGSPGRGRRRGRQSARRTAGLIGERGVGQEGRWRAVGEDERRPLRRMGGSSGTYAAPASSTASSATTSPIDRSTHTATQSSGPHPELSEVPGQAPRAVDQLGPGAVAVGVDQRDGVWRPAGLLRDRGVDPRRASGRSGPRPASRSAARSASEWSGSAPIGGSEATAPATVPKARTSRSAVGRSNRSVA